MRHTITLAVATVTAFFLGKVFQKFKDTESKLEKVEKETKEVVDAVNKANDACNCDDELYNELLNKYTKRK